MSSTLLPFTRWPDMLAAHYREQGCWRDEPLIAILARSVASWPERTAIVCGDREWSYAMLDERSTNMARNLSARGLTVGDTAVVQLPNIAEFYCVFFALLKIGVAPVNALMSHNKFELSSYCQQLKPTLIIGSAEHALFSGDDFIASLVADYPSIRHVVLSGRSWQGESLEACCSVVASISDDSFNASPADEVAFFQLSGGSTGTPKLIPRTHNDYEYSVRESVGVCGFNTTTRYLCALPAAHNFVLSSPGALGVFMAGGTVVLGDNPSPDYCFELIEKHCITVVSLVPPALILWLQCQQLHNTHLPSLDFIQVGGAALSPETAAQVPVRFGCKLQQVFGMAEGLVNYTRLSDSEARVNHCQGRPMSEHDELKVVNESGECVDEGEIGQLATQGPYTVRGYFNAPEHNQQAFDSQGYYLTGDLVRKTTEGDLQVVGRIKEQINRGGEKIAAAEIENLLLKHECIANAAIVPIPDERMGEKTCVFVITHVNCAQPRPVAIRRYLRNLGVAAYKVPDRFEFVEQFPLTPVGKVNKRQLAKQALACA